MLYLATTMVILSQLLLQNKRERLRRVILPLAEAKIVLVCRGLVATWKMDALSSLAEKKDLLFSYRPCFLRSGTDTPSGPIEMVHDSYFCGFLKLVLDESIRRYISTYTKE